MTASNPQALLSSSQEEPIDSPSSASTSVIIESGKDGFKEEVLTSSEDRAPSPSDMENAMTLPQSRLALFQQRFPQAMLYVVSVAQFIDIANGSSMTVALVDISDRLGFDSYNAQWIISSYIVTFGGFLLLAGRCGDIYGHRQVFLAGQIWFGVWSLVVSFTTSPVLFSITRALQGIGASMSVPSALGLITTNIPAGPKRIKALSIFSGFGACGAVVGLLLAGALVSSLGWAWIFRFSSIFSFALFVLGVVAIPSRAPSISSRKKIDIVGSVLATSSLICIIYYVATGSSAGWASVQTLPVLAAGIVLLGAFLWVEARVASHPIMPLHIWRLKNFSSAFVAILFLQGQFQGFTYFTTLIFQNILGYSSMQTALAFLAHSLAAIVTFTILGKILPKYRLKPFILIGFLLRSVAAIMFAFVEPSMSYWGLPFCGLLVHVLGLGTSTLPAQIIALKDAQNEEQGVVGALYSTGMQIGAPIGLVIVTAISENTVNFQVGVDKKGPLMESYRNGLFTVAALGFLGIAVSLYLIPNAPATQPAPATQSSADADPAGTEKLDICDSTPTPDSDAKCEAEN